jgi:predicted RNA-binding protein (TIGR00451 family)
MRKLTTAAVRDRFAGSKLKMSIDYIFGRGTSRAIDLSVLSYEYSRKTGRIRHVKQKGQILFTFRSNGSISPSIGGAALLLSSLRGSRASGSPSWKIIVKDEVSDLVSAGKTVFCKHVVKCSKMLRPNEDVVVLNESTKLLAVGRSVVSGESMKQFKRGPAVKVRQGSSENASHEL